MNKYPYFIAAITTGFVISLSCSIPTLAQDKKSNGKVQLKITENGKVKKDTTFTIDGNFDQHDIDRIIGESGKEKSKTLANKKTHKRPHKEIEVYRFQGSPDFEHMDSMMEQMDKDMNTYFSFKSDDDSIWTKKFNHPAQFDSIVGYKDGKPQKLPNPRFPEEFAMDFQTMPDFGPRPRHFFYRQFDRENEFGPDVRDHVIIRKHISPGDEQELVEEDDDNQVETIENSDDVVIKRKKSQGKEQITVEKNNPDVTIKKGKKKIEIIIEDKKADEKDDSKGNKI